MRKLIIAIALLIILLVSCKPEDSTFLIKVSGTEGLFFSGSYMTTTVNGQVTSKSVEGIIPAQYSVKGMMVSATFQKDAEDGYLKVEIFKDGEIIADEHTIADYGLVSIAA